MTWNLRNHALPAQGYTGGRASPAAIAAAIAVHVGVGGVILMMPPEMIEKLRPQIIWGYPVPPEAKPEPPVQPKAKKEKPFQRAQRREETVVTPGTDTQFDTDGLETTGDGSGDGGQVVEPITPTRPDPVFVQATVDPKRMRDFQPDYPGAMIRAQIEGFATVRVFIATDGRVETVELVDTNNAAFWQATREQALRHWRFRAATRDGAPVASTRVMTVRFRLSDLD